MQSITITDYNYEARIMHLAKMFKSEVENDCGEYSFKFDNQYGQGIIRGINFDHGVSVISYDIDLKQPIKIKYCLGRRHPVQFHYTNKGEVHLETTNTDIKHSVNTNEAMIYAPKGNTNYEMVIQPGNRIQIIQVEVVRFLFLRKVECDLGTIPTALKEMFHDTIGTQSFYFETASEPVIVNTIADLFKSDQSGLERKLLIEAKSLKLITTLIKRFRVESDLGSTSYRFSGDDIKLINKAKNFIIDNIHLTPTVKELSHLIGMNTNKLQKGFNLLFSKSIRQFTITLKMHIALSLLDEGNLSISEIAYKIGYTNKGHFSQLFKKEFGLLPSEYINRISQLNPVNRSNIEYSLKNN